ncbi:MAG: hypothetical protein ACREUU_16065, partial [Gammaproteobacteria bacterium]
RFVNTPEWSTYLGGEYVFPMQSGAALAFRVDYSHKSTIANDVQNYRLLVQDPIDLVNLSATWTSPSEQWEFVAGGRNVTDERYMISGFRNDGGGVTSANFSAPAEWFLTVRYNH